jgi:hypothetical protein
LRPSIGSEPAWKKAAKEVQALIKGHPEDAAALDGMLLLTGEMRWSLDDELTNLALRKKDDPRMGRLYFNLPNLKVGGIAPEIDGNDLEGNRSIPPDAGSRR